MTKRLYFPLKRNTDNDARRENPDPIGNFSCLIVTAKFLDIEKYALPHIPKRKVTPTKARTLTRADGSTVTRGKKNTTGIQSPYEVAGGLSKGSRRIILTTGKKVDARQGSNATYHTISFRFPSFATILTIADALGSLIPANKIKSSPTATDVYPYFRVEGGRQYAIMQQAAAQTNTDAQIALTMEQIKQLGGSGSFIPGAGV